MYGAAGIHRYLFRLSSWFSQGTSDAGYQYNAGSSGRERQIQHYLFSEAVCRTGRHGRFRSCDSLSHDSFRLARRFILRRGAVRADGFVEPVD